MNNAVNLYLEGIRDGNYIEAVNKYTGDRYTQHSTGVKDGKEGFIEFFGDFVKRNPVRNIEIVRKITDGKNLFIHAYQNINNGEAEWVTTDFFDTDDNDKIIEHWDVISEYCGENLSKHTSVDGCSEITDLDKTEDNKRVVREFITEILMENDNLDKLSHYVSKDNFQQHLRDMKDGFDSFSEMIRLEREQKLCYKDMFLTVCEGNFVATLSRVERDFEEICRADIFRLENGVIVEYWSNSEPVPKEHVNSGKF